jgi:zinc resistance-associated protein
MDELQRNHYKDTSKLRGDLWAKSDQLDILLDSSNPDPGEVRALQKDISNLRAQLADKRLDLEIQSRKVAPDAGNRRGYARGYGQHMRGFGHRGGYGFSRCGY